MCVLGVGSGVVHLPPWRSVNNFVKSVLAFYLYMGSREQTQAGFHGKCFTCWAIVLVPANSIYCFDLGLVKAQLSLLISQIIKSKPKKVYIPVRMTESLCWQIWKKNRASECPTCRFSPWDHLQVSWAGSTPAQRNDISISNEDTGSIRNREPKPLLKQAVNERTVKGLALRQAMAVFTIMRLLGGEGVTLGRVLPKWDPTHSVGWVFCKNGGNMASSYGTLPNLE